MAIARRDGGVGVPPPSRIPLRKRSSPGRNLSSALLRAWS